MRTGTSPAAAYLHENKCKIFFFGTGYYFIHGTARVERTRDTSILNYISPITVYIAKIVTPGKGWAFHKLFMHRSRSYTSVYGPNANMFNYVYICYYMFHFKDIVISLPLHTP